MTRFSSTIAEKGANYINTFFLLLLCIITVYPFVYVLMYSISDGIAAGARQITVYPVEPTLVNFKAVFSNNGIMRAFFISVSRTVIGSITHLAVTSMAAYALSRKGLLFKKWIIPFYIIPMYFSGGLLPTYVVITKLNLTNNFLVYILPAVFNVFHMLILKVFFEQLPESLEESAKIDGASDFIVFSRIVLPSSMPVIATVFLFIGVFHWNEWFDAFLYVSKSDLYPLQTLLYKIILSSQTRTLFDIMRQMQKETKVTSEALKMATVIVATVPILAVYPFMQKYFVKGMMIGVVKG